MGSFTEKTLYTVLSMFQERGPDFSRFRQFLNLLGCIIVIPIYSAIMGYTRHPLTLDILLTIFAAEYNRYANESRRRWLQAPSKGVQDLEKASYLLPNADLPQSVWPLSWATGKTSRSL